MLVLEDYIAMNRLNIWISALCLLIGLNRTLDIESLVEFINSPASPTDKCPSEVVRLVVESEFILPNRLELN